MPDFDTEIACDSNLILIKFQIMNSLLPIHNEHFYLIDHIRTNTTVMATHLSLNSA